MTSDHFVLRTFRRHCSPGGDGWMVACAAAARVAAASGAGASGETSTVIDVQLDEAGRRSYPAGEQSQGGPRYGNSNRSNTRGLLGSEVDLPDRSSGCLASRKVQQDWQDRLYLYPSASSTRVPAQGHGRPLGYGTRGAWVSQQAAQPSSVRGMTSSARPNVGPVYQRSMVPWGPLAR